MDPDEQQRRKQAEADRKRAEHLASLSQWRKDNRDKVNARKRQKYAEDRQAQRKDAGAQKRRSKATPESNKKAARKWREANRDKIREIARRYRTLKRMAALGIPE